MSADDTARAAAELWPPFRGPSDLPALERVPLSERGLPASTYDLVRRAAELWPTRRAVSVLPDGGRFTSPFVRTFAELADDVDRAAGALAAVGVRRGDAVSVISVNCAEMLPLLLAAEAVGIYAPINPGLNVEHATELVRMSGSQVIVAAGPELDPAVWANARAIVAETGARALLALRPTAPSGEPPALEPLGTGTEVDYLSERMANAGPSGEPIARPDPHEIASYLHTGGTTGIPKLAARTHTNEVANAWMIASRETLDSDSVLFAGLPLFHTNALLVTVLAPLLKGQHVVWGGALGYRDPTLYPNFWKIVEQLRHRGHVGRSDRVRDPRRGAGRCRHLEPQASDRRCRAASAGRCPCLRGAHRCRAMRGLWAHRRDLRERVRLERCSTRRERRTAPALPGGARRKG